MGQNSTSPNTLWYCIPGYTICNVYGNSVLGVLIARDHIRTASNNTPIPLSHPIMLGPRTRNTSYQADPHTEVNVTTHTETDNMMVSVCVDCSCLSTVLMGATSTHSRARPPLRLIPSTCNARKQHVWLCQLFCYELESDMMSLHALKDYDSL
jgi:hypothetical protein